MRSPIPTNEKARLKALHDSQIMDSGQDPVFDDLAALAGDVCGLPISLINFIDENRIWRKAGYGLEFEAMPRDQSICAHALNETGGIIVTDIAADERFQEFSVTAGGARLRFYAGIPIEDRNGYVLGTVCVLDHQPRRLSERQIAALGTVARQVAHEVERHELRRKALAHFLLRPRLGDLEQELRLPLGQIREALATLQSTRLDGLQREQANAIQAATGALEDSADDILALWDDIAMPHLSDM